MSPRKHLKPLTSADRHAYRRAAEIQQERGWRRGLIGDWRDPNGGCICVMGALRAACLELSKGEPWFTRYIFLVDHLDAHLGEQCEVWNDREGTREAAVAVLALMGEAA